MTRQTSNSPSLFSRLTSHFRSFDGPLTQRLVREPGGFGLGQVPASRIPDGTTTAVCGFCSTGCGLKVHLQDGKAVNLSPDPAYPVNLGMACPKGWEALTPLSAPDRGTRPLIRNRRGKLVPLDWDAALATFVERFRRIGDQHGPESVAFISTGQIVTEEMMYLGALAKFGMGMIHGDGNTRQCMATAATAYKQSFGFDAPPFTYRDFEESDVLVFVGSNLCIAHPIMWERVCMNPHSPEIIVIDPRRTETAMAATQHYPIRPKSDLAFFYGLAHILIEKDWIDHDYLAAHSTGYDDFAAHVASYTPERAAEESGIPIEQIYRLAATIAAGKRVSFWWTMGVNQHHEGVRVAQSLINLALMTGNMGRPGTGANSITGQCNAMGSRLFSNTTSLLGGHSFENPVDRERVAGILGIPNSCIPEQTGMAYDQIIEGIAAGKIKGLWVIATNTAHSWFNQNELDWILKKLDFLVVQDMYPTTETAVLADLYLPAAGWGEKEGTFINSERRIGRVKRVAVPPGEAQTDFAIFQQIAKAWGCDDLFARWQTPADVFETMKELSAGRPCDITGIRDYQMLDDAGGVQWPLPAGEALVDHQRRLFADGRYYHADGRARLLFDESRPMPEPPCRDYPLILLSGRGSSAQWHTQTRTSKSAVLRSLYPADSYVEVNPGDARRLGLQPNAWVIVESRRGRVRARLHCVYHVQPGQVFMPMHYVEVNRLTYPAVDPHSRQPSYKACAVRLRAVTAAD